MYLEQLMITDLHRGIQRTVQWGRFCQIQVVILALAYCCLVKAGGKCE